MTGLKIGLADVSALNFDQSFLQLNAKKKINAKKSSRFEFWCWILKTASLNISFIAIIMLTSQWRFWVRISFFKMKSSLCAVCLPLTLTSIKLNVRPEMSTEPIHSLTLMNNGKAFSSLDGMTCSYQCSDQFQFLAGHWQAKVLDFLRPWKNPVNLFKNNLNKTRNNSLKFKKKNGGIVELLIPTFFQKQASHAGKKTFLGTNIMRRLF